MQRGSPRQDCEVQTSCRHLAEGFQTAQRTPLALASTPPGRWSFITVMRRCTDSLLQEQIAGVGEVLWWCVLRLVLGAGSPSEIHEDTDDKACEEERRGRRLACTWRSSGAATASALNESGVGMGGDGWSRGVWGGATSVSYSTWLCRTNYFFYFFKYWCCYCYYYYYYIHIFYILLLNTHFKKKTTAAAAAKYTF